MEELPPPATPMGVEQGVPEDQGGGLRDEEEVGMGRRCREEEEEENEDLLTLQLLEKTDPADILLAYFPTVAFAGCQCAWAIQISYTSATLRSLGLARSLLSVAWLAGPISGMIVQPLVGAYSDVSEYEHGRRRIYIVAGAILTVIGLLGFSNAEAIGNACGDGDGSHPVGLTIAIISFFFMDFAINCAQGPLRALLTDRVHDRGPLHTLGNAFFAMHNGIGKVLGYGIGGAALMHTALFSWMDTQLRALYTIGCIIILVTVGMTVFGTPERQWTRPPGTQAPSSKDIVARIYEGLKTLPLPVSRAFHVQCCAYFGWFALFVYGATWVAHVVYGGDATADDDSDEYKDYEAGVRAASRGYMFMAAISVVFSHALGPLVRLWGVRIVWAANLLFFGFLLMMCAAVSEGQHEFAIVLIALMGLPLAATYQLPWSIVTLQAAQRQQNRGRLVTLFNLSQCLPEIVVSVLGYIVVSISHSVTTMLVIGGLGAVAGAVLCIRVIDVYDPAFSWEASEADDAESMEETARSFAGAGLKDFVPLSDSPAYSGSMATGSDGGGSNSKNGSG